MKLKSVELALPERLVTNDEVVDRIGYHSRESFSGDLPVFTRHVLKLLRKCGADTRHWADHRALPIHYIADAASAAIARSTVPKREIDMVVYVGVDRGFYEPANAYFIADYLGLPSAQCFDVVDACNGWSRALQICDALFQAGQSRCALIVNGEFPMFEGGPVNPRLFQFSSVEQLRHRFPAFTLGECAAATIVTAEADGAWEYHSSSHPRYADLCTVSCHGSPRYSLDSKRLNIDGPGFFVSFGQDMVSEGLEHAVDVLRRLSTPLDGIAAIFPHAVSQLAIDAAASSAGARDRVYTVFPRTGNLISASVPAGLSLALGEGRLNKGDIAAGWVGSAGMVFSAYTFTA